MKFHDKYPQLKDKQFLIKLLTENVYGTMALEDQHVAKLKVQEIVLSVLESEELKGTNFFRDKAA